MYIKKMTFSDYKSTMENFYIELLEDDSYETILHEHDTFQILLCKQGSITHYVSGKSAKLLRGDISIVPPNADHYITINEPKSLYYNISFDKILYKDELSNTAMIRHLMDNLEKNKIITPKFTPMYEDIYLYESARGKMRIEYSQNKPGREEIIINCLTTILSLIARMYIKCESDTMSESEKKIQQMNQCIFYADSHYDEPIPLDKIVKMSAMSRATFCSMFKKMTGMPFVEYLNKKRIERAQSVIRDGSDIAGCAYKTGFREMSTFYRNFIKYTGMTPSEYKRICEREKE